MSKKLTDKQLLEQIAFLMKFPRKQAQDRAEVLSVYLDDLHYNNIDEMERDIVTEHIERIDDLLQKHGYLDRFEHEPDHKLMLKDYKYI